MWNQIILGNNLVTGSSGVLYIDGEEQVVIERNANTGHILVSVELYDESGAHIAKLRRNAWAFSTPEYEVKTSPAHLQLIHKGSGIIVFQAGVIREGVVRIAHAQLFTKGGKLVRITPDGLEYNSSFLSGNHISGFNVGIKIDDNGLTLGSND